MGPEACCDGDLHGFDPDEPAADHRWPPRQLTSTLCCGLAKSIR
jgi:hypothetical protein